MSIRTEPDDRMRAMVGSQGSGSREHTRPQADPRLRIPYTLSALVAALMLVASTAGLFVPDLYHDGTWAREALRGGDLATLVAALPILIAALWLSIRNARRAQAIWIGTLAYSVYTYAFYVFGAAFNDAFLIHIALLSASIFALILGLPNLDVGAIAQRLHSPPTARWIGGFLAIIGVLQGGLWVFVLLRNAATGQVLHDIPVEGQHLVFGLDLSLLVPTLVLAGVLLWRQTPMGYLLGAAMCVMGALYQLNLMLAGVFQSNAGVAGVKAFPPEGILLTVGLVTSAFLLLGRRTPKPAGHDNGSANRRRYER